jgi:hypothetical protein
MGLESQPYCQSQACRALAARRCRWPQSDGESTLSPTPRQSRSLLSLAQLSLAAVTKGVIKKCFGHKEMKKLSVSCRALDCPKAQHKLDSLLENPCLEKKKYSYKTLRMNIEEGNLNFRVAKDGLRSTY